jgi:hypothetical protein
VNLNGVVDDAALARELSRLCPHREHESSAVTGLLCRVGIHHWRQLALAELARGKDVRFCYWCSKVKVDGAVYEP